jgi:hypothetical protein
MFYAIRGRSKAQAGYPLKRATSSRPTTKMPCRGIWVIVKPTKTAIDAFGKLDFDEVGHVKVRLSKREYSKLLTLLPKGLADEWRKCVDEGWPLELGHLPQPLTWEQMRRMALTNSQEGIVYPNFEIDAQSQFKDYRDMAGADEYDVGEMNDESLSALAEVIRFAPQYYSLAGSKPVTKKERTELEQKIAAYLEANQMTHPGFRWAPNCVGYVQKVTKTMRFAIPNLARRQRFLEMTEACRRPQDISTVVKPTLGPDNQGQMAFKEEYENQVRAKFEGPR